MTYSDQNDDSLKQTEMPVTLLIPNPRMGYFKSQISFMQVARLIYFMALLGQQKNQVELHSVIKECDYKVTRTSIKLA
jgi:hypothetical protein